MLSSWSQFARSLSNIPQSPAFLNAPLDACLGSSGLQSGRFASGLVAGEQRSLGIRQQTCKQAGKRIKYRLGGKPKDAERGWKQTKTKVGQRRWDGLGVVVVVGRGGGGMGWYWPNC